MREYNTDLIISPSTRIQGEIYIPGDKSISHRALLFAAIAEGKSNIYGLLMSSDVCATMAVLQSLGVHIDIAYDASNVCVYGVGLHGLQAADSVLDAGNSGTCLRLLAGLLAGQSFHSSLTGDASLRQRPMGRIVTPLSLMGANIKCDVDATPPLHITGSALHGISYALPVASAQVKSCLLLAGLYATGETLIKEPVPTRDHTERLLTQFAHPVRRIDKTINIQPAVKLQASDVSIPGDLSSAAFFIVAALITEEAELSINGVGMNPTRAAIIEILQQMGANISLCNQRGDVEPIVDIIVKSTSLSAIDIPLDLVPAAIDELPILMIAAACATGVTRLRGAAELRVKESNRLQAMLAGFHALGISATAYPDGMDITGGELQGGVVDSYADHRIAMAFAIAAIRALAPVTILNCANIQTSFPGFVTMARNIGINVQELHAE